MTRGLARPLHRLLRRALASGTPRGNHRHVLRKHLLLTVHTLVNLVHLLDAAIRVISPTPAVTTAVTTAAASFYATTTTTAASAVVVVVVNAGGDGGCGGGDGRLRGVAPTRVSGVVVIVVHSLGGQRDVNRLFG